MILAAPWCWGWWVMWCCCRPGTAWRPGPGKCSLCPGPRRKAQRKLQRRPLSEKRIKILFFNSQNTGSFCLVPLTLRNCLYPQSFLSILRNFFSLLSLNFSKIVWIISSMSFIRCFLREGAKNTMCLFLYCRGPAILGYWLIMSTSRQPSSDFTN